jgi:tetratricopeptide (TPR) repeat protein
MRAVIVVALLSALGALGGTDLEKARDAQDRPALERASARLAAAADRRKRDAEAQYRLALVQSYIAEVATERHDKRGAAIAADKGVEAAQRAVALDPNKSEYHRILGTLCGQAVPGSIILAMKYGKCALDEVNKAVELNPRSPRAYLSRGVGEYYLPAAFGGSNEIAIRDFEKAISLDPRLAEAHLWLGLALRRAHRNAEARREIEKSLELDPGRVWARQQLAKTPA